jgi:hypothetical protein
MPSQPEPHRICIFGDSQIGSLRNALTEGLTAAPAGSELEFWGAPGPSFRLIDWSDGAIRAKDSALEMVLQVNGNGRSALAPDDFDTFVFYGARYRVAEFFGPYLQWMDETGNLPSAAVLRASARMFSECTRAYRMAVQLAKDGCNVIYVPAPFYTDGINDIDARGRFLGIYPGAANATADHRAALWSALVDVAGEDGITLVPQPEDTVTRGALTLNVFAREGATEIGDTGHKSPAFAARWMQDVWPLTQALAKAA